MAQDAPMLFPMYTVAADELLKMTKVEPHEKLKAGVGAKFRIISYVMYHIYHVSFIMYCVLNILYIDS